MVSMTTSKVSRWDGHGREHVVRIQRSGVQRLLRCDTCGWRRSVRFSPWLRRWYPRPWLKAEEHLVQEHQATVDPTAT
ncbi:hypothetical protein [Streptomyces sp. NPDC018833]|uniref:hypothetical protein n=1 Tax=Streptomyces sp. NPDC018833 TaxID=3365053 RepID=UPI0037B65929